MERRTFFCINCRNETEIELKKVKISQTIREKPYDFWITTAVCKECGEEVGLPGLIDRNTLEIDEQYRKKEDLLSVAQIQKLMEMYNIGKAPLSLALGFGEITISRYLAGQVPSKEYSNIMKKALQSPSYMISLLNDNITKVGETAYKKAMAAAQKLKDMSDTISPKLQSVIAYIFGHTQDITPLALQKMLYYSQGISLATLGHEFFPEDCQAWVHGPVYSKVYEMFRDFKYNPIDDTRFPLLSGWSTDLTDEERHILDLVLETFGMYSGKVLEHMTHEESPWKEARKGCLEDEPSQTIISKAEIQTYFSTITSRYPLNTMEGIKQYISSMIKENG